MKGSLLTTAMLRAQLESDDGCMSESRETELGSREDPTHSTAKEPVDHLFLLLSFLECHHVWELVQRSGIKGMIRSSI